MKKPKKKPKVRRGVACPHTNCGSRHSAVVRTRLRGDVVHRRHVCAGCGKAFGSKQFPDHKVPGLALDLAGLAEAVTKTILNTPPAVNRTV